MEPIQLGFTRPRWVLQLLLRRPAGFIVSRVHFRTPKCHFLFRILAPKRASQNFSASVCATDMQTPPLLYCGGQSSYFHDSFRRYSFPRIHLVPAAGQGTPARGIRHVRILRKFRREILVTQQQPREFCPFSISHFDTSHKRTRGNDTNGFRISAKLSFPGIHLVPAGQGSMARGIRHGNSIRIPPEDP